MSPLSLAISILEQSPNREQKTYNFESQNVMVGIKHITFKAKKKMVALSCIRMTKSTTFKGKRALIAQETQLSVNLIDFQKTQTSKANSICKNSWHTLDPSKIYNTMNVQLCLEQNVHLCHVFFVKHGKMSSAKIDFLHINPILALHVNNLTF